MPAVRSLWPILLGLSPAIGCNLLVSDWRVGQEVAGGAGQGANAPAGGTAAGASGPGGASCEGGELGGGVAQAEPLQMAEIDQADDPLGAGVTVWREGKFRIEAGENTLYQWGRWFHWPTDPTDPLGPEVYDVEALDYDTVCLWSGVRGHGDDNDTTYAPFSYRRDWNNVERKLEGEPMFKSDLPVSFEISAKVEHNWHSDISFSTRVFASGRVWTSVALTSTVDHPVAQMNFGAIALSATRFDATDDAVEGLFTMGLGGNGAIFAVDVGTLSTSAPGNTPGFTWVAETIHGVDGDPGETRIGTWQGEQDHFAGQTKLYRMAFLLGDKATLEPLDTRDAITADLRNPRLVLGDNATTAYAATGGMNPDTGTYELAKDSLSASSVSFQIAAHSEIDPTTELASFAPAFEVASWTSPTFVLRKGCRVLATESSAGEDVLLKLAADKLIFQYLPTIEATESESDRTFTISEQ